MTWLWGLIAMLRHIARVVAASAMTVMVTAAVAAEPERADGAAAAETWRVQIASLTTRDDALREWRRLQGRHRDLLAALGVNIARADLDPGTFFRVQAGPIADRGAAAELCSALAARGQACLVVPAREPDVVVVTAVAAAVEDDAAPVLGPVREPRGTVVAAPAAIDDVDAASVPVLVPASGPDEASRVSRQPEETIEAYAARLRAMTDHEFLRHIGIIDVDDDPRG